MNALYIPNTFTLFGHKYMVEWVDDLMHNADRYGEAVLRENKIRLQVSTSGCPRSQQELEHTYLHELLHCILYRLGYEDLKSDEQFVETVSGLLHQALITAE